MAITYLNAVNRILNRINQTQITDVTSVTGHAKIVTDLFNEAQIDVANIENWHTLVVTRTFSTVASTATYAVASDFMKCISVKDTTNNQLLYEENEKLFDLYDPQSTTTGIPTSVGLYNSLYRFYPIPAGVYSITEKYYKNPLALTANTSTFNFPDFCENVIIYWVWNKILEYIQNYNESDRIYIRYKEILENAIKQNRKLLNKNWVFNQYPYPSRQPIPPSSYRWR